MNQRIPAIGLRDAGRRHYWLNNLKLPRLQLEWHPTKYNSDLNYIPGVIVLWGSRSASVRVFTDYLVAVREQEYQGYWHYLLDVNNGFWQSLDRQLPFTLRLSGYHQI